MLWRDKTRNEAQEPRKSAYRRQRAHDVFDMFDLNHDGTIDHTELVRLGRRINPKYVCVCVCVCVLTNVSPSLLSHS